MPRAEISHEEMHKLIELVRRNPVLYDPANKDYKDYSHIESAWNRITKQMGRSDMSGYEWRKKWVNRRDTYVKKKRHIRNHRSPTTIERVKRWRFFDDMSFLDRYFEGSNDSVENNAANEDESSESMSDDEDPDESTNVPSPQKSDLGKRQAHSTSPPTTSFKRKPPADAGNNNVFSVMPVPSSVTFNGTDEIQSSSYVNTVADQMDPHLTGHFHHSQSPLSTRVTCPDYHLLFQSYAHRLERLPDRVQSFIQLQIAQLFFNAENPDLAPMAIIPLPSTSILMSSSSSSSSSSTARQPQRRRYDDVHEYQQQQLQQQTVSQDTNTNLESEGQMGLDSENSDDTRRKTLIKAEQS